MLRKSRDSTLSHDEMVSGLQASNFVVTRSLENLSSAGLVSCEADGSAQYRPAAGELDRLVAATEDLYAKSPNAVRRLIAAAASPGITAFADAFRLRKDDE